MKVKLSKGSAASPDDVALLEAKLGEPLVRDYLTFLERNDGAEAESNICAIDRASNCAVTGFIPVRDIPEEMSWIENLPDRAFPIAWAEGGNYVLLDQGKGGAVFFWDHELPDDMIRIADDFDAFLETLEPFDPSSVVLKPEDVKKAWIDPDFLKSLGE